MRHFLIDTDTVSADAVALVMALTDPGVQVEAITTVAGRETVDQATQNTLYTVELCGKPVPVYRGAAHPLARPLPTAGHAHGEDGMGDIGLPLSGRAPASGHAVQALIDTIHRFAGEITLVTLGPLTNLALALEQDPSIAREVKECIVMGGVGDGHGNITPVAEFNIWFDPEAAKKVFEAGLPLKMVGWDACDKYGALTLDDVEHIRRTRTPLATFCMDIQKTVLELSRLQLPDPLAMAVALDPTIVARQEWLNVAVETTSELCRGQTVVDHFGVSGRAANTEVVLEVMRECFLQILEGALISPIQR